MKEKILSVLETDGRISLNDLAFAVGEPVEKVSQAIMEMEADNVICGYHALINWDNLGQERADAFIEVKVTPQRGVGFDDIAERIWQYPEVSSIYLISGSVDFVVFIEGKSMREVAMFVSEKLSTIDGVISTTTQFILKKYKENGFVIVKQKKDERVGIS